MRDVGAASALRLVMILAHWTDITCLVAAFVGPSLLVLIGGRVGFCLGIPAFWIMFVTAAELHGWPNPDRWLLFSWMAGLLWCTLVYVLKRLVMNAILQRRMGRSS